jgi:hypothetical protein
VTTAKRRSAKTSTRSKPKRATSSRAPGAAKAKPRPKASSARTSAKPSRAKRSRNGDEKVAKLGIEREPGKLYAVFNGNVFVAKRKGSDNVIFMPGPRDFRMLRETGVVPEPGYLYFLDADGDLARIRRT